MSEWISVKDRMPVENQEVLAYAGGVEKAMYRPGAGRYTWDCDTFGYPEAAVTHWMPLPDPPKEGE